MNKINAEKLLQQNRILTTMQKTISKMRRAVNPTFNLPDFSLADTLKRGMRKHGEIKGFKATYKHVKDSDDERDKKKKSQKI